MQGFLPRKACDRCHVQKLRCDRTEGPCTRCTKANITCVRSPSLRRERSQRSRPRGGKRSELDVDEGRSTQAGASGDISRSRSTSDVGSGLAINISQGDAPLDARVGDLPSTGSSPWMDLPAGPLQQQDTANHGALASMLPRSYSLESGLLTQTTNTMGSYQALQRGSISNPIKVEVMEAEDANFQELNNSPSISANRNIESIRELSAINPRLHENAVSVSQKNNLRSRLRMPWLYTSMPNSPNMMDVDEIPMDWEALGIRETLRLSQDFISILVKSNEQLQVPPSGVRQRSEPSPYAKHSLESSSRMATGNVALTNNPRIPQRQGRDPARRRWMLGSQSSTFFGLSCYMCLLDTYDDVMRHIESDVNLANTAQGAALVGTPQVGQGSGGTARLVRMRIIRLLNVMGGLLGEMRHNIRASSSLWDIDEENVIGARDHEDISSPASPGHDNDTTKVAVLATKVREQIVLTRMDSLRQTIAAKDNNMG